MKDKKQENQIAVRSAKEVARTAVFVAALIGAQYALSAVPFVEVVTLLFVCYAYVFGAWRGVVSALVFALIRQLIFGFYPVVLILYLVHFSALSVVFGALGKGRRLQGWKLLLVAVALATVMTACFTLLDNLLTPLWYAYTPRAAKIYFNASLPFLFGQSVCAALSVGVLFFPIRNALLLVKKS